MCQNGGMGQDADVEIRAFEEGDRDAVPVCSTEKSAVNSNDKLLMILSAIQ